MALLVILPIHTHNKFELCYMQQDQSSRFLQLTSTLSVSTQGDWATCKDFSPEIPSYIPKSISFTSCQDYIGLLTLTIFKSNVRSSIQLSATKKLTNRLVASEWSWWYILIWHEQKTWLFRCLVTRPWPPFQMDLERAQFLLRQAFDEDEGENKEEASELYMQAVEMFIKIVSNRWKCC